MLLCSNSSDIALLSFFNSEISRLYAEFFDYFLLRDSFIEITSELFRDVCSERIVE